MPLQVPNEWKNSDFIWPLWCPKDALSAKAGFEGIQLRKMVNDFILNLIGWPQNDADSVCSLFPGISLKIKRTKHLRLPLLQKGDIVPETVLLRFQF